MNGGPRFARPNEKPVRQSDDLVNEAIRFPEVLVIDVDGTQLGVKSRREALYIASSKELDLLCVAPQAKPPVCKIINYGKYRFTQQKKAKEMKKNQKVVELKEVRLTPQTDIGDLKTKASAVEKWIKDGDKVKVSMRFKGRQLAHIDVGEETMARFLALLEEFAVAEKKAAMDGKYLIVNLSAKTK